MGVSSSTLFQAGTPMTFPSKHLTDVQIDSYIYIYIQTQWMLIKPGRNPGQQFPFSPHHPNSKCIVSIQNLLIQNQQHKLIQKYENKYNVTKSNHTTERVQSECSVDQKQGADGAGCKYFNNNHFKICSCTIKMKQNTLKYRLQCFISLF